MSKKRIGKIGVFIAALIAVTILSCISLLPDFVHNRRSVDIPDAKNGTYTVLNDNIPEFTDNEITDKAYEFYSELDRLGRCGYAIACIGREIMPTEDRQSIGQVKPSGWQISKYDFVDGKYLYNRCHLIGFQLTGENANERNLITGTRYMNVDGMLPFENMVADYIKETGNHVMYRVTPAFDGNDLVAKGVQMEARSVEDNGEGILFNVFVYNKQPGIEIDYVTGNNWLSDVPETVRDTNEYVLNINSKRFHLGNCESVSSISEKNREIYTGSRQQLIDSGYKPCGTCNP